MAKRHLLALPAQELAVLLTAADQPQYAHLFGMLPCFRAALTNPIDVESMLAAREPISAIEESRRLADVPRKSLELGEYPLVADELSERFKRYEGANL
ncbi:hypothetical protein G3A43_07280 [Paraburkholderia aspalathi]|nr:hypothetical protein [Paraburkholderia aspalathi]MBK3780055.1 hypothetical protein [Paraburkholderia aspalathi]